MAHQETYYSTNGSINLECVYRGESQGSLQWLHESEEISDGENEKITQGDFKNDQQIFSLSIMDVSVAESKGKYSCVWSNDDGDKIIAETEVVVRQAKILSNLSFENQPYAYAESYVLELQCQLESDVEPESVVWQHGDSVIIFDDQKKRMNTHIIHDRDYGVKYFSNITLEGPENVEDEEYFCISSFSDGHQVTATAKVVNVHVKTDGPFIFFDYKEKTDIFVNCSLVGDLGSVGTSVENSLLTFNGANIFNQTEVSQINYPLHDLSKDNDGLYECSFTLKDGKKFSATQNLIARSMYTLLH